MYRDAQAQLSNAQDIHAASVASTNNYDFGVRTNYDDGWNPHPGNPNFGKGNPIRVLFTVTTLPTAGTDDAKTLTINLQDCTTYNGTYANLSGGAAGPLTGVQLRATPSFEVILPDVCREFLQAYFTLSAGFATLGISAEIVVDTQTNGVW